MSKRTIKVTRHVLSRVGGCLIGTAILALPPAAPSYAEPGFHPVIIRGTGRVDPVNLRLAYLASFPNGSMKPSVDKLNIGPMAPGDPLIPDSNPTVSAAPGEAVISIHRPVGLPPDLIPAESLWATPVGFGPGSVVRISATFRAPVGPLPGGGFAMGLVGRTGAKDDLPLDPRVATTINVRPGFLVRLNVPFGSVETRNMVLPQAVKDAIFSTTDPQPFTLELTINRKAGTGTAKLMVIDQVFSLNFTLADFRAGDGPTITAVGPGVAVNSNGPGQTASVHVRDFRIYSNVGG
jgi:hypothetical protein